MKPIALNISNISISQDEMGRYCLNDLHQASGGDQKHRPKYWLENQQTKELIDLLNSAISEGGIPPSEQNQTLQTIKGGIPSKQGTFACKELVYAYAMWISPVFHLHVIRTYDEAISQKILRSEEIEQMMLLNRDVIIDIRGDWIRNKEELKQNTEELKRANALYNTGTRIALKSLEQNQALKAEIQRLHETIRAISSR